MPFSRHQCPKCKSRRGYYYHKRVEYSGKWSYPSTTNPKAPDPHEALSVHCRACEARIDRKWAEGDPSTENPYR